MTASDKTTVFAQACAVINTADPVEKCQAAFQLKEKWDAKQLSLHDTERVRPITQPARPEKPLLVKPSQLPKRSIQTEQGRVCLMHAIAHIEFNAIDLACDAVYRFRGLPSDYYQDWINVAADEARHFGLVTEYLSHHNTKYGDYAAHNGLWQMAEQTAGDVLTRLAIVPRVLEARGLDVSPAMIEELQQVGDRKAVEVLQVIYQEEIEHVAAGSRWFNYICQQQELNAEQQFLKIIKQFMPGSLRGELNREARLQAGFTESELVQLQS